jgi:tRNA A37 methylthiotransferase MiaB
MAYGKLPCFKMVYFPGGEELVGSLCRVRITAAHANSLIGEQIDN